jgi:hypothetical protein
MIEIGATVYDKLESLGGYFIHAGIEETTRNQRVLMITFRYQTDRLSTGFQLVHVGFATHQQQQVRQCFRNSSAIYGSLFMPINLPNLTLADAGFVTQAVKMHIL